MIKISKEFWQGSAQIAFGIHVGCNQANASRLIVARRGILNMVMMLANTEVEDLPAKMLKSWI